MATSTTILVRLLTGTICPHPTPSLNSYNNPDPRRIQRTLALAVQFPLICTTIPPVPGRLNGKTSRVKHAALPLNLSHPSCPTFRPSPVLVRHVVRV